MKLVSYEVQTSLGRFERIGALAFGTIVDLNAACVAYLAESLDANAARRQAEAAVPPDMNGFLEGGCAARELADRAVAYAGERLKTGSFSLGPHSQRLAFDEPEVRWLAPVPRPPMIRTKGSTLYLIVIQWLLHRPLRLGVFRLGLNLRDPWRGTIK